MGSVCCSLPHSKSTPNISSQSVFDLPFQVHQDSDPVNDAEMGKEKAKRIPLANLPVIKPQEFNESKYIQDSNCFSFSCTL